MLCCAQSLSCVQLFETPWSVACQALLSMGILQARILEWVAMLSSRESSQPRDWTQVSHIANRFFTVWATRETPRSYLVPKLRNSRSTAGLAQLQLEVPDCHSCPLSLTLCFALFWIPTGHKLCSPTALSLPPKVRRGKGIPQVTKIQIIITWVTADAVLWELVKMWFPIVKEPMRFLSLSHCPMWNPPLYFSSTLCFHNKVSFSLYISMPF